LRNQVPILKKAVLDEQTKNADLAIELKFKEQKIRKYDSEIESLTFRNEQLLKRVESLQSMINELQSLSHHNNNLRQSKRFSRNFKLSSSQSDYNVANNGHATTGADSWSTAMSDADKLQILEEELKRKLLENENLHRKIHEQELKTVQDNQYLTSQIGDLRDELSKCKEVLDARQHERNFQNGSKNFTSPKHDRDVTSADGKFLAIGPSLSGSGHEKSVAASAK
uniref:Protein phosphatase 1 regulatory subunit 21 N-terminal domain-containing protein n=1 Tax=Romanomermis culicivorax TaxID=13658 RepID=A0A915L0M9_ROMCU